jgi:hypothetical protein
LPRILPSTEALEKAVCCVISCLFQLSQACENWNIFWFSKSGCWDFYCSWVQQSVAKNTEWGL